MIIIKHKSLKGGWMDQWRGVGWLGVTAVLRIAHSNQKKYLFNLAPRSFCLRDHIIKEPKAGILPQGKSR